MSLALSVINVAPLSGRFRGSRLPDLKSKFPSLSAAILPAKVDAPVFRKSGEGHACRDQLTEMIWTHRYAGPFSVLRLTKTPAGIVDTTCRECGGGWVIGAIIGDWTGEQVTKTADDKDPNLLCASCGFWRD